MPPLTAVSDPLLGLLQVSNLLSELLVGDKQQHDVWQDELGVPEGDSITFEQWQSFMVSCMRRHAEAEANFYLVNATTPAQLFHVLRRQVNPLQPLSTPPPPNLPIPCFFPAPIFVRGAPVMYFLPAEGSQQMDRGREWWTCVVPSSPDASCGLIPCR